MVVFRENKNLVFFSVPYSEGWSATVNGKPVEIEKVNVGFMAVPVEAGNNVIVFTYKTPLLDKGIMISFGAIVVFLIYFLISTFVISRSKNKVCYPEGDILLARWQEEEKAEFEMRLKSRLEDIDDIHSILDDGPVSIPSVNNGFEGGFKIDLNSLDEQDGVDNE